MSDAEVDPVAQGARVLERLAEQPGGPELLEEAAVREDIELVGGAVRDLLLGRDPRELDVVVAEDAPGLAHALAARLSGSAEVQLHERFGTALVLGKPARIDVATRRAESYPAPGALPQVRAGTPEEDLLRRDFSINAIAVGLDKRHRGQLRQVPGALADLREGRIRVLYDESFIDDPTRILRFVRYWARFQFEAQERTALLAHAAIQGGALHTVSRARLGSELRLALTDVHPLATLALLDQLGVLRALHPQLGFDAQLTARALELLAGEGRRDMLLLAVALLPALRDARRGATAEISELLNSLEFSAGERDLAIATARAAAPLLEEMPTCATPAELHELLCGVPLEAVALAGALGGHGNGHSSTRAAAIRWLRELRHVRLQITGADLLAAGIPEGPEIGRRLQEALALRLNGELPNGREAELSAALELP